MILVRNYVSAILVPPPNRWRGVHYRWQSIASAYLWWWDPLNILPGGISGALLPNYTAWAPTHVRSRLSCNWRNYYRERQRWTPGHLRGPGNEVRQLIRSLFFRSFSVSVYLSLSPLPLLSWWFTFLPAAANRFSDRALERDIHIVPAGVTAACLWRSSDQAHSRLDDEEMTEATFNKYTYLCFGKFI